MATSRIAKRSVNKLKKLKETSKFDKFNKFLSLATNIFGFLKVIFEAIKILKGIHL